MERSAPGSLPGSTGVALASLPVVNGHACAFELDPDSRKPVQCSLQGAAELLHAPARLGGGCSRFASGPNPFASVDAHIVDAVEPHEAPQIPHSPAAENAHR